MLDRSPGKPKPSNMIGASEGTSSALYAVPVQRDAETGIITGLTFSPHRTDSGTGFAMLQCSTWQGAGLFNISLSPAGEGLFTPVAAEQFVTLPRQGTGAIQYFPSGPLQGHIMYVNWDYGEVMVLFIDAATGLPFDTETGLPTSETSNPIVTRIAHDFGVGPWGLEFDPLTLDFFVATWGGSPANSIVQIAQTGLPTTLTARVTGFAAEEDGFRLTWYGPPGWTHRLVATADLRSGKWEEVHSAPDAPFAGEHLLPKTAANRFIRLFCTTP